MVSRGSLREDREDKEEEEEGTKTSDRVTNFTIAMQFTL